MNKLLVSAKAIVRRSSALKIIAHVVRPHNWTYHKNYYAETVEPAARDSAASMASSIIERFKPRTVIDVGCGTGALLETFRELGCEVYGLEYSDAALAYCHQRQLPVKKFNITRDQLQAQRYDVAVSFEVAEHLPSWSADRYVRLLCSLSPLIVMSAATPSAGGGTDHINEQPHSYWIDLFTQKGHIFDPIASERLASAWRATGVVAYWYPDNVMVFRVRD